MGFSLISNKCSEMLLLNVVMPRTLSNNVGNRKTIRNVNWSELEDWGSVVVLHVIFFFLRICRFKFCMHYRNKVCTVHFFFSNNLFFCTDFCCYIMKQLVPFDCNTFFFHCFQYFFYNMLDFITILSWS